MKDNSARSSYETFRAALEEEGLAPNTTSAYLADVAQLCSRHGFTFHEATPAQLASLNTPDIDAYFAALTENGICFRTRARNLSSIRKMYDSLISRGLLTENPARPVRLRWTPEKRLPVASIVKILSHLKSRNRFGGRMVNVRDQLIILVMLFLGAGVSRIPRLLLSDLKKDALGLTLRVTDRKLLPLEGAVLSSLNTYLALRPYAIELLFVDVTGRHAIRSSAVKDLLASIASDLRIDTKLIHPTYLWLSGHTGECDALHRSIEPHLA